MKSFIILIFYIYYTYYNCYNHSYLTKYLNTLLHGDQVAAFFIMLVTNLAFLVMKSSIQNAI